jgi:hypothetical protein
MYKHYPSLVFGFHACEKEIGENLLSGKGNFKASENDYDSLKDTYLAAGWEMPQNKNIGINTDKLLRKLDCAVFEYMHDEMKKSQVKPFDSIRAAFWEGQKLYPNAGFKEKNHIQICIRNPNCIKGYFRPLKMDSNYPRV